MLPEIEQLLILQDCDRKIRTLKFELKVSPDERKEVEERLVTNAANLESQRQLAKTLEVEKKKLEGDAQAKRDLIGKFRGQQFQTRKNEEFQALGNEIKHAETDIQTIEDRELEVMDQIEKQRVANIATEQESAKAKTQLNQQLTDIDAKTKALADQLAGLETDRAKLSTGIDEDLLSRYERLFASKGDLAVVPLEHEVCMGCHMKITTQTAVRVKGGREIVSCEQCARILYHVDAPAQTRLVLARAPLAVVDNVERRDQVLAVVRPARPLFSPSPRMRPPTSRLAEFLGEIRSRSHSGSGLRPYSPRITPFQHFLIGARLLEPFHEVGKLDPEESAKQWPSSPLASPRFDWYSAGSLPLILRRILSTRRPK